MTPRRAMSADDPRVSTPLFTIAEAARYLHIPPTSLSRWATHYGFVTRERGQGHHASVPFVGLAEAFVLAAFRETGLPMQRIRPAIAKLRDGIGLDHALAAQALYTDGAEILYDYAESGHELGSIGDLVVVRSEQRVFVPVIDQYLKRISYDEIGWAHMLKLPAFDVANVVVDPTRAFGQPIIEGFGVRVEDVVDRYRAGETKPSIAHDFDLPVDVLDDVLRAA